MMKLLLPVLLLACCATGCRTRYEITLSSGTTITAHSRPVLDRTTGMYRFKDAQGRPAEVSTMRVREIERK